MHLFHKWRFEEPIVIRQEDDWGDEYDTVRQIKRCTECNKVVILTLA